MNLPGVLFVDDEPHIIQSLRRALHSSSREWRLSFAQSGQEALALMRRGLAQGEPIDLLVSDMRMPEMNGAELLKQVRQKFPHTIRFVLSGHSDQDMILQTVSSAHQFLSKPCEVDLLKQCIRRAFGLRSQLRTPEVLRLASGVRSMPTPDRLFHEICDALQQPRVSLEEIGEMVAQDPTVSSRILHLANSAFFGLAREVVQVPEAVVFLGIQIVKAVILSASIFESQSQDTPKGKFVQSVQEHSLLVAGLSRHLCLSLEGSSRLAEECFIAGLLHDLGKLLLLQHSRYFPELPLMARSQNKPLHAVESLALGCHHGSLGGYLLGLWGLPDNVVEAVLWHHHPEQAIGTRLRPLVTVSLANAFVSSAEPERHTREELSEEFLKTVNLHQRLDHLRTIARQFLSEARGTP